MKFKSIKSFFTGARETLQRFPLVMASASIGTMTAIIVLNGKNFQFLSFSEGYLIKLIMASALGIPLFLSVKVFIEIHDIDKRKAWAFQGACVLLLVAYFFSLPAQLKGADGMVFALLEADLHLLVAMAPFIFLPKITNAFWQYNRGLFLRFILAFIYSNTIFFGLAIALRVTDSLFFIKFDPKVYTDLWFIIIGLFNTWFFLGGVPKNIRGLEEDQDYPEGLRVFTQFVLIPLVLLYLAILYIYMGKIIVAWSLPHGWLSSFIIGVAIFGILTLLLVHPLTDKEGYPWFRIYKKYFYLALFPLIVLMVFAIARRISDYGMTEQRYFVLLFAAWLLVVALLFTFKSKSSIRSIPLTLFLLVALVIGGPWSAISVSKKSQMARLKNILTGNGLLVGTTLHRAVRPLNYESKKEITSIVDYLDRNFGLQVLAPWFDPPLKFRSSYDFITKYLGLEYVAYQEDEYRESRQQDSTNFSFFTSPNQLIKVSGYDYFTSFYVYEYPPQSEYRSKFPVPEGTLEIWLNANEGVLNISWNGRHFPVVKFTRSWMSDVREKYGSHNTLPREILTFKGQNNGISFEITLQNVSGTVREKDKLPAVTSIQGNILFAVSEGQGLISQHIAAVDKKS